jgi:dTDP-glucose 4,6-dehydratase
MRLNDGRVVPAFISQILHQHDITIFGDGSQTRSFCYVSDLVRGIMGVMEAGDQNPINLGNPSEITIKEFAEKVISITGSESKLVYQPLPVDDPQRRRPDITRAREIVGWEPKISLEEGLINTLKWAKENV